MTDEALLDPDRPCIACGNPTVFDKYNPRKYCSKLCCQRTQSAQRRYCIGCGRYYLGPSLCDPYCSLRCQHGRTRKRAA